MSVSPLNTLSSDTRSLTLQAIGYALSIPRFGFKSRRRAQGMTYWLAERGQ